MAVKKTPKTAVDDDETFGVKLLPELEAYAEDLGAKLFKIKQTGTANEKTLAEALTVTQDALIALAKLVRAARPQPRNA